LAFLKFVRRLVVGDIKALVSMALISAADLQSEARDFDAERHRDHGVTGSW
jgi:hypothetical protein